jgi:type I restriction enzyme S subunit
LFPDDLLPVILYGPHTRRIKLVTHPFVAGPNVRFMWPASDYDAEFSYYMASAADVPSRGYNDHFTLFRQQMFARPTLREQRVIATALREARLAHQATERVLSAVRQLRASMLERLFAGGVGSTTSETVVGAWPMRSLGQMVHPDRPICYGIVQPGPDVRDGVPFVNLTDCHDGEIDVGRLKRTSTDIAARNSRSRLQAGDVLVSIRATAGRIAVVPPELDGAFTTRGMARVSPAPWADSHFISYYLQTSAAQAFLRSSMRGVALRQVNIRDLRQMPAPAPPLEIQTQIAGALQDVDAKLLAEKSRSAALETLFSVLLRGLTSGRIQVSDS